MNIICDRNVPQVYAEAFWKMRVWAEEAQTRNGPVMRTKDVFLEIRYPDERVLFDRVRMANPFFHLMEAIWMLSGENEVAWLKQFNRGIEKYAEDDGHIHGAYGHRWRSHFGTDQIMDVHEMLMQTPNTRRGVIAMWDAEWDCFADKRDLPCNTHIYATMEKKGLEFTVCNRSNDLVWGMLGANCVHMTFLQQVMAESLGVDMASYKVFTKDLHVYTNLPNFKQIWDTRSAEDPYSHRRVEPSPILFGQSIEGFLADCDSFIRGHSVRNRFLQRTAAPMRDAYLERINGGNGAKEISEVEATDWKYAGLLYIEQKELASATKEAV